MVEESLVFRISEADISINGQNMAKHSTIISITFRGENLFS